MQARGLERCHVLTNAMCYTATVGYCTGWGFSILMHHANNVGTIWVSITPKCKSAIQWTLLFLLSWWWLSLCTGLGTVQGRGHGRMQTWVRVQQPEVMEVLDAQHPTEWWRNGCLPADAAKCEWHHPCMKTAPKAHFLSKFSLLILYQTSIEVTSLPP